MANLKLKIAVLLFTLAYFFSSMGAPVLAAITYTYDQNGNMASDGIKCYEYNEANQLKKVKNCINNQTISEYVYDYQGNRLVKKEYENGTLKRTVYSPTDESETVRLASNSATENTSYYFVNNQLIAKKNPDGTKNYYHNDHLGSTSVLTNQTGTLVEETKYDPWGEVKTGGTKSKYLYTGQEKDLETSLNYYNARYYDSHIRRFTQPDDIIQNPYNPQELNRYSYVKNNPLRYTDPSGQIVWVPILISGAGAAIGAYEAVTELSLTNPNATWQQKVLVGAGGAVIGAGAAGVSLYIGAVGLTSNAVRVAVPFVLGGLTSGAQQAYSNVVTKQSFGKGVITQSAVGAISMGIAAPIANKFMPATPGRPVTKIFESSKINNLGKKSVEKVRKESLKEIISSNIKVAVSVVTVFFNPPAKDEKKK